MAKNDDAILVRLPKQLREQAQQMAEKQDRPLAWIVRKLLQEKIAEEGQILPQREAKQKK